MDISQSLSPFLDCYYHQLPHISVKTFFNVQRNSRSSHHDWLCPDSLGKISTDPESILLITTSKLGLMHHQTGPVVQGLKSHCGVQVSNLLQSSKLKRKQLKFLRWFDIHATIRACSLHPSYYKSVFLLSSGFGAAQKSDSECCFGLNTRNKGGSGAIMISSNM